jgi:hypothetical protein
MEPLMLEVASTAGRMLISVMRKDVWPEWRGRIARLFAREDDRRVRQMSVSLDESRSAVLGGFSSSDVVALRWQGRFEALMEERPEVGAELAVLIREIDKTPDARPDASRTKHASGNSQIMLHNSGGGTVVG